MAASPQAVSTQIRLASGSNRLSFVAGPDGTYSLLLSSSAARVLSAQTTTPVTLYFCQGTPLSAAPAYRGTCPDEAADPSPANTATGAYSSVTSVSDREVTATAKLSHNGGVFLVTDSYVADRKGAFTLNRTVSVQTAGSDTGFNSQFSLAFAGAAAPLDTYHFMAPAILYNQNAYAPGNAIAANLATSGSNWFYWRETRCGLPMLLMQDDATGTVLSVARTGAAPAQPLVVKSGAAENSSLWLVDPSVQYGSVGLQKVQAGQANAVPTIGIIYPAVEGDVTYVGSGLTWSRRSHPVYAGFTQTYAVTFDLKRYANKEGAADFATALGETYHRYYNFLRPPLAADHTAAIFDANISLSKQLFAYKGFQGDANTYPGLPFSMPVTPPTSTSTGALYSYEMGFTGEQPLIGFQLLRSGVLNADSTAMADGQAILDFWAKHDLAPMAANNDLPLTWFEPTHQPQVQWSNTSCAERAVFSRELSDGMEAMVRAAEYARTTSALHSQVDWERFINLYASWLLSHQNPDGSFDRFYDPTSGKPCLASELPTGQAQSASSTPFFIRFLVRMYFATNDAHYMAAARSAAAYAWSHIYQPMAFTGGVLTDYQDREAGAEALHAALAMYDLEYQQDPTSPATRQWLQAAEIAANYLQTWQYAYNIQITDSTPGHQFASYVSAGSQATSLLGLGGSGGDIFLSFEAFDFFRLHLLNDGPGEPYLHFAEQLEYNSKLTTNVPSIGQDFGYQDVGLVTEVINLTPMNFSGTATQSKWLSWLTGAELDSQQQLEDVFGNQSIRTLTRQNQQTLREQNHRLYPTPGSLGWTDPEQN